MRPRTAFLAIGLFVAGSFLAAASAAYALYSVANKGTWPETWPKELDPLRKQARTLIGPHAAQPHYEIPFTRREDFESAWPYLLKVKSPKAPIILVRGPNSGLGLPIRAGVRIAVPPPQKGNRLMPDEPLPGQSHPRATWMYTTFIELIVDGNVVDLNRIPLPPGTPIVDERFEREENKAPTNKTAAASETGSVGPVITTDIMDNAQKCYELDRPLTVRFRVGSVGSITVDDVASKTQSRRIILSSGFGDEHRSFDVALFPEAQAALKRLGIENFARHFIGKMIEVEGHVTAVPTLILDPNSQFTSYYQEIRGLKQIRAVE
jgi:hypothetical protein